MYQAFEQLETRDLVSIAIREKELTAMDDLLAQYPRCTSYGPNGRGDPEHHWPHKAKAQQFKAILELARRYATYQAPKPTSISGPKDVAALLADTACLDREVFKTILLNTKHHVLSVETVAIGGLASCSVHPREVFKAAIKRSASAVILAHNHPSGDPVPSSDDIKLTQRFVVLGKLLGIPVLDHIVIGTYGYVSINERGGIQ